MNITVLILIMGLMLLGGYLFSLLFKLIKFPPLIGTIFFGIVVKIIIFYVLKEHQFFEEILSSLSIIISLALGIEAFAVGGTLLKTAEKQEKELVKLTILQVIFISIFTITSYLIIKDIRFSLLLGAFVGATAPIAVLELANKYQEDKKYQRTLKRMISFDNTIALVYFFIIFAITQPSTITWQNSLSSLLGLLIAIAFGAVLGFVLVLINKYFIKKIKSEHNKNVAYVSIIISLLLIAITGSLLLSNHESFDSYFISEFVVTFVAGIIFGNLIDKESNDRQEHLIHDFSTPLLTIFFVNVGMELDFTVLVGKIGILLVVYFALIVVLKMFVGYFLVRKATDNHTVKHSIPFSSITLSGFEIYLAHLAMIAINNDSIFVIIVLSILVFETLEPVLIKKFANNEISQLDLR